MLGKSISSALLLSLVRVVQGQVTYNETSGAFTCAGASGAYCASDFPSSNIIIRCNNFVGTPGNCNDNLAGITPVGVKISALCYQTSTTAGDAVCSFNNVGYPDDTAPFAICNGSASSGSSSSTSISSSSLSSTVPTTYTKTTSTSILASAFTSSLSTKYASTLTSTNTDTLANTETVHDPTSTTAPSTAATANAAAQQMVCIVPLGIGAALGATVFLIV